MLPEALLNITISFVERFGNQAINLCMHNLKEVVSVYYVRVYTQRALKQFCFSTR